MSKDKILIEFAIGKLAPRILKIHDESRAIFPFFFFLRDVVDSTRIGVWMNSRISSIGKDLLKRVVTDERSHGPLGMTLGLSLNDTFWVQDGSHTWEEVNLYENPLNPEIAELAFTQGLSPQKVLGSRSPEFGSSGNMRKCWFKRENEIFLKKRDDPDADGVCQTTKEWFAAQVAEAMGLTHVAYDFRYRGGDVLSPVCECRSFTDISTGFAPAAAYLVSQGVDQGFPQFLMSTVDFHRELGKLFGGYFYEDMLVFDAVVGNKDRHMLYFGVLYDNDSGRILKPAPIFDIGLAFDPEEQCCFFPREEQFRHFVRSRHKEELESVLHMSFRQHDEVRISETALGKLESYVKNFVDNALSYLPNN